MGIEARKFGVKQVDKMKVMSDRHSKFMQLEGRSLKNIRASMGFKPVTSAIPVRCSICWVEHRTGIAEVTGSNPVEALIFFRVLPSNC